MMPPPPSNRPPPSTPSSPPAQDPNARYVYLVARLRNRQITMEEATELFAIMDDSLRLLRTAASRPVTPPPAPAPVEARPPSPAPAAGSMAGMTSDDLLAVGILLIGAGAGVSAALRERSKSGPKLSAPSTAASGVRSP